MLAHISSYPLDPKVLSYGRYLEAIDKLNELDIYERGILRHIGSRIPLDADVLTEAVNCSFGVLAITIGMHAGTAQKKIKALQKKGFIRSTPIYLKSYRGRSYRGPNAYTLTFQVFTGSPLMPVPPAADEAATAHSGLAVQEIKPIAMDNPPEPPPPIQATEPETKPLPEPEPEPIHIAEQIDLPIETNLKTKQDQEEQDTVNRLVETWQNALNMPVSEDEKQRFFQAYIQTTAPEAHVRERIELISRSPTLSKRVSDINSIFKFVDLKYKNSAASERATMAAKSDDLNTSSTVPVEFKNKGASTAPSESKSDHLGPSVKAPRPTQNMANLPKNNEQLMGILKEKLAGELTEKTRNHAKIILLMAERCPFSMTLTYFQKYILNSDADYKKQKSD